MEICIVENAWYVYIIVKMLVGFGQFAWGLFLIYLSITFHLWLMNKYKRQFFRDELTLLLNKVKARDPKIDLPVAVLGLAAAVYQGAVFLAILLLMGSIQTPFG